MLLQSAKMYTVKGLCPYLLQLVGERVKNETLDKKLLLHQRWSLEEGDIITDSLVYANHKGQHIELKVVDMGKTYFSMAPKPILSISSAFSGEILLTVSRNCCSVWCDIPQSANVSRILHLQCSNGLLVWWATIGVPSLPTLLSALIVLMASDALPPAFWITAGSAQPLVSSSLSGSLINILTGESVPNHVHGMRHGSEQVTS